MSQDQGTVRETQGDVDTYTDAEKAILDEARKMDEEAAEAEKGAVDAKADEPEVTPEVVAQPQPQIITTAVPAPNITIDEALAKRDFAAEMAAIDTAWSDGDIDQSEYNAKLREITLAQARLEAQQQMAQAFAQQSAAAAQTAFEQVSAAFLGRDGFAELREDGPARQMFNAAIQKIDTETGGQLDNWTLLDKAHQAYREQAIALARAAGIVPADAAPANPAAAAAAATAFSEAISKPAAPASSLPPARIADLAGLPPRLGGLPAASTPTVSADLEELGALPIHELEARFHRMSPEQREQYLAQS